MLGGLGFFFFFLVLLVKWLVVASWAKLIKKGSKFFKERNATLERKKNITNKKKLHFFFFGPGGPGPLWPQGSVPDYKPQFHHRNYPKKLKKIPSIFLIYLYSYWHNLFLIISTIT